MSELDHFAAVKALLETGGANPMSLDDIKRGGWPTAAGWTVVFVTERYTEPARLDEWSTTREWRVQVRAMGSTERNAKIARENARKALEDAVVTVGGRSAPIGRALSHEPIGEDGEWFSGMSEYGYAH